jgi:Transposase DDE domain
LVARDGVPLGFYYKAHVGVDGGRQRIITAVDVTPGEVADEYLLDRLLKEHAGVTRRQVEEVVADTKYGTPANYVCLEEAGIRATIPPHSAMRERGEYRADHFVYDLATDRYRCPNGQYLRRQGSSRTAGAAGGIIYRGQPKVCGACPVKAVCCPTGAARTLLRPDDAGLRERTLSHLRTSRAWRHRRQRSGQGANPSVGCRQRLQPQETGPTPPPAARISCGRTHLAQSYSSSRVDHVFAAAHVDLPPMQPPASTIPARPVPSHSQYSSRSRSALLARLRQQAPGSI